MSINIETVRTHGFTMRFFCFGTGESTLVILPGLSVQSVMGSADAIARDYAALAHDFTLYVFDRREELPESYCVSDMARDTAAAFDALSLRGVCLFGASQGGMIAMELAASRPDLVSALALGSTALRVDEKRERVFDRWIDLARTGDAAALYLAFGEAVYPPEVFAKYRDALTLLASGVTQDDLRRFAALAEGTRGFDATNRLAHIDCPILALGSRDDAVLGADAISELAAALEGRADCESFAYDGFGHAAYDLAPDYKARLAAFFGAASTAERRAAMSERDASALNELETSLAPDGAAYRDARFTLGERDGVPYLTADGRTYLLSCHGYEPCMYITGEGGALTAVHNSFDPSAVLAVFRRGGTVTSITGREYDARDFCEMVEYAAGMGDAFIDDAERVFGDRPKKKPSAKIPGATPVGDTADALPVGDTAGALPVGDADGAAGYGIIRDDPFLDVVAGYPDSAVDFCLVKSGSTDAAQNAHRNALACACRELLAGDGEDDAWTYDLGRARARRIGVDALFAPEDAHGALNYRRAFLSPPWDSVYTDADFAHLNATLFPNGTDGLEAYEWTTDWSDYFDDGHEWWGALCLTVYDKSLDRFAVILASATD